MHRMRLLAAAAALAAGIVPAALAAAHVTKDAGDGNYAIELGFDQEPAYLGQPNAIYVKVSEYASGGAKPLDGLAGSLNAEVEKDGRTLDVPLIPEGDGVYIGPFFPTALGDYTFRVTGDIDGVPIAVEETSSPSTFDPVQPLDAVQFPQPLPDAGQVAAMADAAFNGAASAQKLGLAGIAIGTLGLAFAGVALARKR